MADLTTEQLLDNKEYVKTLYDYTDRKGAKVSTPAQALEYFLGDYRGVQANTALALKFSNDVENIKSFEERQKLGKLYKAVDEDLESFAGNQTGLQTVTEYGVKGILDPLNLFGLGIGKVVASTVGRAGVKKLITNAFAKKAVTSPIKQGIKAGALTEGGIGVVSGLLQEDIKGKGALEYQDEMNLGNVALQGAIGTVAGGVLGGLGAKLGQRATKNVESIAKEAEATKLAKSTQHKVAQSKNVESFLTKIDPETNKNYVEDEVLGTYVESAIKGNKLLTDNPDNYGVYGRIMDVEKGEATVEFIPTKYSKEKNPLTNKFDERLEVKVPLANLKATSLKNKDDYLKQFVEEYGLFFDKAGIEQGKALLKGANVSDKEIDEIFTNTLTQDAYEDMTRFVFDAGKSVQQNMPDSKLAKQVEIILDDPTKRVTEKVATLLQLGSKNKELLSEGINKALASSGRSVEELVNLMKADVSVSAGKVAAQSDIQKLLDPTSTINKKLNTMMANQTDSQKKMLDALAKERQLEKQLAKKFGVSVDLWRSFLVTQPATTMRNIIGSVLRVPGETLSSFSDRAIIGLEAKALGIDVPDFVEHKDVTLLAKNLLSPYESVQLAQMVSKNFPEADRQLFKLFDDYFSSTLSEKTGAGNVLKTINYVSQKANVLNRMQDRAIKSAGFMTELDNQIKVAIRRGEITDPDIKGIEDVIRKDKMNLLSDTMVSKSLEFAYKLTYQTRNAGDDLVIGGKMINNLQNAANRLAIVKLGIPFPNFIFNGLVYNINRIGFGGPLKAMMKSRKIFLDSDDTPGFATKAGKKIVEAEKARSDAIKIEIKNLRNLNAKEIKALNKKQGRNYVTTELKNLTNELESLDANVGQRLKDVSDFRNGIVESFEGVTFIAAAYAIREKFGGARYDELKVGNATFNAGPLFPLTPYLWVAEAIRKSIDDEPFDSTFIGEGIEALTGFQTDRAGPLSKFVGGLRKSLDTLSNSDDPNLYKKIGEEFGAFAGYLAKGYLTPLKAFDDLGKTIAGRDSRITIDRDFQNVMSEETDNLVGEAFRGVINEFSKQMFRGTIIQGVLGGEEDETISPTGEGDNLRSAPILKQFSGVAEVTPRDSVGDELERLGIPSWKLATRSSVPEYTRLYKIYLGQESEKFVKPLINSPKYKALPFKTQLQIIRNIYYGNKNDMSPGEQKIFRALGPLYNNLREKVSKRIKSNDKFLDQLHKFRTRNSKAEINEGIERARKSGFVIPTLKYLGKDTIDNKNIGLARKQAKDLEVLQSYIDNASNQMGRYINTSRRSRYNEGGYVSQMDRLGFAEGGLTRREIKEASQISDDPLSDVEGERLVTKQSSSLADINDDGTIDSRDAVQFAYDAIVPTAPSEIKSNISQAVKNMSQDEYAKAALLGTASILGASEYIPVGGTLLKGITRPLRKQLLKQASSKPDVDTSIVKSDIAPEGLGSTPNKLVESKEDVINFRNDSKQIDEWRKQNSNRRERVAPEEVKQEADLLSEGKTTSRKFRETVKKHNPSRKITIDDFPEFTTKKSIAGALKEEQRDKILDVDVDIPDGTVVGSRLDITAYKEFDKWVVSLHEPKKGGGKGKIKAYGQVATLKGGIKFDSSSTTTLNIARQRQSKTTIGRIEGKFYNEDPEKMYKKAYDIVANPDKYPEWVQVGFNPDRGSQFYITGTNRPVFEADEAIQVGRLVLAKNVKKPTKEQYKKMRIDTRRINPETGKSEKTGFRLFNAGGAVNKQMNNLGF